MLVLSRQNGEQLHLETKRGEVTKIFVTDINGHQTRIAFDASRSSCLLSEDLIFKMDSKGDYSG